MWAGTITYCLHFMGVESEGAKARTGKGAVRTGTQTLPLLCPTCCGSTAGRAAEVTPAESRGTHTSGLSGWVEPGLEGIHPKHRGCSGTPEDKTRVPGWLPRDLRQGLMPTADVGGARNTVS